MTVRSCAWILAIVYTGIPCSSSLLAQAPESISFQGFLADSGGVPVADGNYDLLFKMYKGSSLIWQQTQASTPVVSGQFNVILSGSASWPLDTVAFNQPIDLGITVNGGTELSPRTPLTSVPFALGMRWMYAVAAGDGFHEGVNVIGGAENNYMSAAVVGGTISGGGGSAGGYEDPNSVLDLWGTIGGGRANQVSGFGGTIGGGSSNNLTESYSTIGGGSNNTASGGAATIGGGSSNTASTEYSVIAGGNDNSVSGDSSTVGGGARNSSSGVNATIAGGAGNRASGYASVVPGGASNHARGSHSFAAGRRAIADHSGTFVWNDGSIDTENDSLKTTDDHQFLIRAAGGVGIGTDTPNSQLTVSGNSDFDGRVSIGDSTPRASLTVTGPDHQTSGPVMILSATSLDNSEAGRIRLVEGPSDYRGGYVRYNGFNNSLILGVHNSADTLVSSDTPIITVERNTGDVGIKRDNPSYSLQVGTSTSNGNGAYVTDGGVWTSTSSRMFKEDLRPVNKAEVLESVANLPVYRWRYKHSDEGEHMGPVAEDFYELFRLGNDNQHIGNVDGDGVALAAIQALYEHVKRLQSENDRMKAAMERAGLSLD